MGELGQHGVGKDGARRRGGHIFPEVCVDPDGAQLAGPL